VSTTLRLVETPEKSIRPELEAALLKPFQELVIYNHAVTITGARNHDAPRQLKALMAPPFIWTPAVGWHVLQSFRAAQDIADDHLRHRRLSEAYTAKQAMKLLKQKSPFRTAISRDPACVPAAASIQPLDFDFMVNVAAHHMWLGTINEDPQAWVKSRSILDTAKEYRDALSAVYPWIREPGIAPELDAFPSGLWLHIVRDFLITRDGGFRHS
jgi:hypothetical protein